MKVDQEFKELIIPLSEDEIDRLEASLLKEGCRDALVVWKEQDILLDGHHRLALCDKHDIKYNTVYRSLPGRTEAEVWILENQIGRRNLNVTQRACVADDLKDRKEKIIEEARDRQRAAGGDRKSKEYQENRFRSTGPEAIKPNPQSRDEIGENFGEKHPKNSFRSTGPEAIKRLTSHIYVCL